MAKSNGLLKKYARDVLADTRLDEGLYSIVDKDVTAEEKELSKQQKTLGAIGHLNLQGMEGYSCLYNKLNDLALDGGGDVPHSEARPNLACENSNRVPQAAQYCF